MNNLLVSFTRVHCTLLQYVKNNDILLYTYYTRHEYVCIDSARAKWLSLSFPIQALLEVHFVCVTRFEVTLYQQCVIICQLRPWWDDIAIQQPTFQARLQNADNAVKMDGRSLDSVKINNCLRLNAILEIISIITISPIYRIDAYHRHRQQITVIIIDLVSDLSLATTNNDNWKFELDDRRGHLIIENYCTSLWGLSSFEHLIENKFTCNIMLLTMYKHIIYVGLSCLIV